MAVGVTDGDVQRSETRPTDGNPSRLLFTIQTRAFYLILKTHPMNWPPCGQNSKFS